VSLGLGLGLGLGGGGTPAPFMQVTTTDTTQVWTMRLTAGATYRYDWGDGTAIDSYVGTGADQAIAHNYGGAGTYTVRLWIDDLSKVLRFNCGSNSLAGSLPSFAACTAMTLCYIGFNSFSGSLPSFATCLALATFNAQSNSFSGTLPSFATCVVMTGFTIYTNGFSGTLPSFATCPLATFSAYSNSFSGTLPSFATCPLTSFYINSNSFSSYATGAWAAGCSIFRADTNALDLAAVDAILAEFTAGAGGRPGAGTLNLAGVGGTNAIPTPATKAACIAALPGWAITTK
jgi:hypothetical protein